MARKYNSVNHAEFSKFINTYGKKLDVTYIVVGNMNFELYNDYKLDGEKTVAIVGIYNDSKDGKDYIVCTDILNTKE